MLYNILKFKKLLKIQNQLLLFNNLNKMSVSNVGCLIDIDGVIWHGGVPFESTKKALHLLNDHNVPYVFVTNATYSPSNLANKLNSLLDLSIKSEQVVVAPSPCINLTHYHDKHVLLCCQGDGLALAEELGFKNYTTIEQLIEIFPDLDYVDHERRKLKFDEMNLEEVQKAFKPIEVIILLGEPVQWESALQIIIDLLMTNGDPREDAENTEKFQSIPYPHIPVIACNKDLTFKGRARLPRFGHGAFLECLEHLYRSITKHELKYEALLGKPYMATYKYATSAIEKLNNGKKFDKFFIIGDNPDVDIKGANLFNQHLKRRKSKELQAPAPLKIESILVCTGVYNPSIKISEEVEQIEIEKLANLSIDDKPSKQLLLQKCINEAGLTKPDIIVNDILDATHHIIKSL